MPLPIEPHHDGSGVIGGKAETCQHWGAFHVRIEKEMVISVGAVLLAVEHRRGVDIYEGPFPRREMCPPRHE